MHTVSRKSISTSSLKINQKEKTNHMLEESLKKYKGEMEKQEVQMMRQHKEQEEKIRNTILKKREESINLIKENKEFLKEWESKGRANWSKNMNTFQETKKKDAMFKATMVKTFKDQILGEKKGREVDEVEGIHAFERNLERLGIDINNRKEEGDKKKEQFSIVALMRKIKEKVNGNKLARTEMERRKNKQAVNEETMQKELERKAEEEILITRLSKTCENFQKICNSEYRTQICKDIDNLNRTEKIQSADALFRKKVAQLDSVPKKSPTDETLRLDIKNNIKELKTINRDKRNKKREVNSELIKDIVSEVLEITNLAFKAQLSSPDKQIEAKLMKEWANKFIVGEPVNPSIALSATQFKQAIIHTMSQKETEEEKMNCYYHFINYMQSLGKWDTHYLMKLGQKGIDILGYGMELCIIKDHLLLPCNSPFKESLEGLIGTQAVLPATVKESEYFTPFKLIIIGKPKSGKSELSKYLSVKYNIFTLDVDEQINAIVEEFKKTEEEKEVAVSKTAKAPAKAKAKEEEIKTVENDRLKKAKEEIYKYSKEKKELNDNLIVEIIVALIENKMPKKTKAEYYSQYYQLKSRNAQLEKELTEINADQQAKAKNKALQKRELEIQDELTQNKAKLYFGWALIGFPNSLSQSRALEKALSQRNCDNDAILDKLYSKQNYDISIFTYFSYNPITITLPTHQPDFIYWLVADKKSTDQRFYSSIGNTKSEFEQSTKEPSGVAKKAQRESYISRMRLYDRNYNELIKWMKRYYNMELKEKVLHQVNASRDLDSVRKIVEGTLAAQLKNIETRAIEYAPKEEIHDIKEEGKKEESKKDSKKEESKKEVKKEETKKENTSKDESKKEETKKVEENKKNEETKKEDKPLEQAKNEETKKESLLSPQVNNQHVLKNGASFDLGKESSVYSKDKCIEGHWAKLCEDYADGLKKIFSDMSIQQTFTFDTLLDIQKQFLDLLERPDLRSKLIEEFASEYHSSADGNGEQFFSAEGKKQIKNELQALSNKLWELIEKRKDEACQEKENQKKSKWLSLEYSHVIASFHEAAQIEINKFIYTEHAIECLQSIQVGKDLPAKPTEFGIQSYNRDETTEDYPLLIERFYKQAADYIRQKPTNNCLMPFNEMVEGERKAFIAHISKLRLWAFALLGEIKTLSSFVFEQMNDWIKMSIKLDNANANAAIDEIKSMYAQKEKSISSVTLKPMSIDRKLLENNLKEAKKNYGLDIPFEPYLPNISEINEITEDLDEHTDTAYITTETLCRYLMFRSCGSDIPKTLTAHQVFNIESSTGKKMMNWRHFLIYLALANVRMPRADELDGYKIKLLQKANDYEEIDLESLVNIGCWIDEIIGASCKEVKKLMFNLLRVEKMLNVFEYLDVLKGPEQEQKEGMCYRKLIFAK